MNIYVTAGLIFLGIFVMSLFVHLLSDDDSGTFLLTAFLFMIAGGFALGLGHDHRRLQEAAFTKASESVFVNIRGAEEGYPTLSSTSSGSITLADPSTVLITVKDPTSSSNASNAAHGFKNSSIVAVNLPDSNYTLQGSLASDSKGWCFEIKDGKFDAFYNQNGFVDDNINGDITRVLCSHGLAYDYAGHAIVGSSNPVLLF